MTEKTIFAEHYAGLFTWSLLSVLIVHALSHSPLDLLAHATAFRHTLPGYHASGGQCIHAVSSKDREKTPFPGTCDELVGAHTATVPVPTQLIQVSQVFCSCLPSHSSEPIRWALCFPLVYSTTSFGASLLYQQHTALLI